MTHILRLEKFASQGGEVYEVRLGTKGCFGCSCPDARYRARACKHCTAADRYLDVVF